VSRSSLRVDGNHFFGCDAGSAIRHGASQGAMGDPATMSSQLGHSCVSAEGGYSGEGSQKAGGGRGALGVRYQLEKSHR